MESGAGAALPKARLLRAVPLFASLEDEILADLAVRLRRRVFRRGTIIFHKEQPGDGLYVIETGRVRIFMPSEQGEELTVDVLGDGTVFGELALLDGGSRSASAQALEDTVTYSLSHNEFHRYLLSTPQVAIGVIALLSARLRRLMGYTEVLGLLDVRARVAWTLLQLAERYGLSEQRELAFPLTQTELAAMVGAVRGQVNRVMKSFRAQGLIDQRGRRLLLLDEARLRKHTL